MRLLEQRVVGKWRFLVHHVGSVASKLATGKSFCHGTLVNKGATGSVDKYCSLLHLGDILRVEEVDVVISDKKAQLATLDEYKKSLIFEYVTGKKEVPAP